MCNVLANDHLRAEQERINVVREDRVYDANAIEVGQLGFSLSWSLHKFKMNNWQKREAEPLTILHSKPNAVMISCMPCTNQWFFPVIRFPRFMSGRLGPSNTNTGRKGISMRRAQRKNSVLSSGFSPSFPYAAW